MAKEVELSIRKYIKEEDLRKVFAKVFDESTILTCHQLATKGLFDVIEYIVSTGKEAHVFHARDAAGNSRAVKIYKITTSNFRQMSGYLVGDKRFKDIRHDKRNIVFAWTRKEHNNLQRATDAGVRVPLPLGFMNNVLVMEFIGEKGEAAKPLKEVGCSDYEKLYGEICEYVARLVVKADLVHSDLSEYNILMWNEEPVLIDMGQAVLTSHPNAKKFFDRDVKQIANYFSKYWKKLSFDEVYEEVKRRKEKLEKGKK